MAKRVDRSKNKWISDKISLLVREGKNQDEAVAISYSMWNAGDRKMQAGGAFNYQKTGNLNIAPSDIANINQATGIQFTPEFSAAYFSNENEAIPTTQPPPIDFSTIPIQDITSDNQWSPRKVWYTQRPEWFVGKQAPVEGKDYQTVPYKQWGEYQKSPAYTSYQNRGQQSGMASMQIGGNYYENNNPYFMQNPGAMNSQVGAVPNTQFNGMNLPPNVGFTPQSTSLQPSQSGFDVNQYSNNIPQQSLPNFGSSGFSYDPNTVDPNNLPSSILKPYDAPLTDQTTPATGQPTSDNFQFFNPYGGFSIPDATYRLGQGVQSGNAFDIGVSGLKLATGLGRNFVSGLGQANRRENILQDYQQKARASLIPAEQSYQKGGININPENEGKFTETAKRAGYSDVQSFAHHVLANPDNYDAITVQRANFARNIGGASKKQDGGEQMAPQSDISPEQIIQAYAESIQQDPQAIIQQLQQMSPEEQQQALSQMLQSLQGGQVSEQQPQMQNGGVKKKEEIQVATNEYVAEVAEGDKVAELETGEYLKKPNGEIQQVIGNTHSNGGVKLTEEQLPDGSKILSDHLKVGKEGAKRFNNDYDLGVKSTDTYANVIDKYNRKTGLNKIVEEQESIASKLQKQAEKLLNNPTLEDTIKLNIDFLTEEFQDLELKKQPILDDRQIVFEEVFRPQEESKTGHNFEESMQPIMQQGGTYNGDMIVGYSKQYGLPEDKIREILDSYQNGGLQKYQNGTGKRGVKSGTNVYSKSAREKQSANPEAYGVVKSQEALQNLYNNFPNIINSNAGFKDFLDITPKGEVKIKGNIPLNQQSQVVGNVQKLIDENMRDSAQTIINNPDNFSEDAIKEAQRYFNEETFIPDTTGETDQSKAIRGYDAKLGNFTSGRYSMQMNLVLPEERQMLVDNGITTVKQLKNSPLRAKLSAESIRNLDNVESLIADSAADYGIGEVTPNNRPLETTPSEVITAKPGFDGNNAQDVVNYGLLNLPDQSPLLPDSLQSALKINRRYDRVEAPLVDPSAQINEIRRQEQTAMESLNSLPDAQRASAIAQLQANTQAQLNNVAGQVAGQNQGAVFQANATNAQIQAREEDARATDLQNYENKILKADAITQQNLRNYYNTAQKVNLGNYNTVNSLNLINSMYDNAKYTGEGINMTNLQLADAYNSGNISKDRYDALVNAKKTQKKFNLDVKKKRFGGTK